MLLAQHTLDLNTDCVEFCPVSGRHSLLAVGCYKLDPATATRHGKVQTYRLRRHQNAGSGFDLALVSQTCLSGVLDAKWCPEPSSTHLCLLAIAAADGGLHLLQVPAEESVNIAATCPISAGLLLSVDWATGDSLLASSSDGEIASVKLAEARLTVERQWSGHELEVWCTTADKHSEHVVYSGGDDSCLKGWDLRVQNEKPAMLFTDRWSHRAGVCTIASDPHTECMLSSGSYDEILRSWDARNPSKPVIQQHVSCGGGVWKLKYHPWRKGVLAAACMHAGFKLISLKTEEPSILHDYKAHQSLAYGVDWYQGMEFPEMDIVASCSFYDSLLHVWNADLQFD